MISHLYISRGGDDKVVRGVGKSLAVVALRPLRAVQGYGIRTHLDARIDKHVHIRQAVSAVTSLRAILNGNTHILYLAGIGQQ